MDREYLKKLIQESTELVEEALESKEETLVKAFFALRVFELRITELNNRGSTIKQPNTVTTELEVNEMVNLVKPNSHPEILAVFGYYLHNMGIGNFGIDSIRDLYRKCKMKLPANLSDTISKTIKRGFFAEIEETMNNKQRTVKLTATGNQFVEDRLSDTIIDNIS